MPEVACVRRGPPIRKPGPTILRAAARVPLNIAHARARASSSGRRCRRTTGERRSDSVAHTCVGDTITVRLARAELCHSE
ncbi:hypothetical protein MTO96_013623 [Rhipicephalus appendiculatus]